MKSNISDGINFAKCAAGYVTDSDSIEIYFQNAIVISITFNNKHYRAYSFMGKAITAYIYPVLKEPEILLRPA